MCERCGEIREERHNWTPLEGKCREKCSVCGEERNIDHEWNNGCTCERCGTIRFIGHNWILLKDKCIEKCFICGEERSIEHIWNGCKCKRCGATRDVGHDWGLHLGHDWVFLNKEKGIEKLCSICKKVVWHKYVENQSTTNDNQTGQSFQTFLKEIALKESVAGVDNMAAVEKITDQTFLKEIVLKALDTSVRCAAVKKITDQTFLKELVLNTEHVIVRCAAVKKITDQTFLKKIALSDKIASSDENVIEAAVKKITDQTFLKDLVLKTEHVIVRNAAMEKINDQKILKELASKAEKVYIRYAALKKITDPAYQQQKCNEDIHNWVKKGTCILKCTACGKEKDDHDYQKINYERTGITGDFHTTIEYKCRKCAHKKIEEEWYSY